MTKNEQTFEVMDLASVFGCSMFELYWWIIHSQPFSLKIFWLLHYQCLLDILASTKNLSSGGDVLHYQQLFLEVVFIYENESSNTAF